MKPLQMKPLEMNLGYLFYFINKPAAMSLHRFFGQGGHSTIWNTDQMKSALDYQMQKGPGLLSNGQSRLLKGALDANVLHVKDTMVPVTDAFCLDVRAVYDVSLLQGVTDAGYSRLPVVGYDRDLTGEEHPTVIPNSHYQFRSLEISRVGFLIVSRKTSFPREF